MQATSNAAEKLSTNNLLLVLMLITFLIVGTTGLVAKTLIVGLIRDTKVLSAENKANKTLDKNIEAAPKLITAFQELGPAANVLADALPNDSNFPGLIVALENIASDSAVTLKSVAPALVPGVAAVTGDAAQASSGIQAPKPSPYRYTITFDGSYTSLQRLLNDLELYDRPMRVKAIKLTGNGSLLSGTLDVQTYYQDKAKLPIGKEVIK